MPIRLRHLGLYALLIFSIAFCGHAQAGTTNPNYSLIDTLRLPGPTRWDILTFDPQTHRLFITRGESVDVLDVTTQKIVGVLIPDTHGVHGVALAPGIRQRLRQ